SNQQSTMGRSILKAVILGVVLFGALALQADTLSTTSTTLPGVSYCGGFGCGQYFTQYQQVYNGALFGGPVTLNSLTLYNLPGTTGVVPGHYTVDLSTTTAASAYDLTSTTGVQRWNMDMDGINHSLGGASNFDLNKIGATQIFDGDLSTTNGMLTFTIPGGFAL